MICFFLLSCDEEQTSEIDYDLEYRQSEFDVKYKLNKTKVSKFINNEWKKGHILSKSKNSIKS